VTFGTNPLALGCPRAAGPPLVIDLSMGVMARGKIMLAARAGEPIPEGVAVDAQGQPTRDAARALDGALLPFGGPKGSALALLVEIMAAALTGASLAFELEPLTLFSPDGPAPRLGQSFLVLDPAASAGEGFARRVETLLAQVADQPGARLPRDPRTDLPRAAREPGAIDLPATLHAQLLDLC
jgi:(2R)-3-sulfolactate dehydrogenase (NADP+)